MDFPKIIFTLILCKKYNLFLPVTIFLKLTFISVCVRSIHILRKLKIWYRQPIARVYQTGSGRFVFLGSGFHPNLVADRLYKRKEAEQYKCGSVKAV